MPCQRCKELEANSARLTSELTAKLKELTRLPLGDKRFNELSAEVEGLFAALRDVRQNHSDHLKFCPDATQG